MTQITRRKLIQFGKMAMLTTIPVLVACNGATEAPPENEKKALRAKPTEPATQILTLAARAPSGHNTQPWTIRMLDEHHWILGIAASRRLPAVDATARETLLSLGAFLENLILAAAHYGYAVEYSILTLSPANADVMDLRFRPMDPVPQPLQQILLRRTLRNGYLSREIRASDLASILSGGGNFLYLPSHSPGAKYLSQGTIEANRQQAWRDPAEVELSNWIRWSQADAEKYRNGLTPAGMEIEGLTGWYVRHFYNRASVLSKSFREASIAQATERVAQGGGWLVLTSESDDLPALVETGRKFQRMWLRLRDRKIAIHPMTQMLEEVPWREQVANRLELHQPPQFLLRIGYVDTYLMPVSLRMPAASFAS